MNDVKVVSAAGLRGFIAMRDHDFLIVSSIIIQVRGTQETVLHKWCCWLIDCVGMLRVVPS